MASRVLVCGARSFVAQGFVEALEAGGCEVDTFSRGEAEVRHGHRLEGHYATIHRHPALSAAYDAVVNFAVLKDEDVAANVAYLRALIALCQERGVKRLLHLSSMMVYGYGLPTVDEDAPIETLATTRKAGYGALKIATDQYLLGVRDALPFRVVLVRPGFVLAPGMQAPFLLRLPLGVTLVKGDRRSRQPVVSRHDVHRALLRALAAEPCPRVCLLFPDDDMTKLRYARAAVRGPVWTLPRWLGEAPARLLWRCRLMPAALYSRFEGMYIYSRYSSRQTLTCLGLTIGSCLPDPDQ